MKLFDVIKLIKFRYHLAFLAVIVGALVAIPRISFSIILPLLLCYVSFNILVYGGIYTLNDIADVASDRLHPQKKERPVASGRVSVAQALGFSLFAIALGLAIGYWRFGLAVFLLYLAFVLVNQYYTRIAKKIPYWEIVFNAITYGMRFSLGALIVDSRPPYLFTAAIFLLACGVAIVRRIVELNAPGSSARAVLKYYTQQKLEILQAVIFVFIVLIFTVDLPHYLGWYLVLCLLYLIATLGTHYSKTVRSFFQWLWLK